MRHFFLTMLLTAAATTPVLAQSVTVLTDEVQTCGNFVVAFDNLPDVNAAQGHWISIDLAGARPSDLTYRFKYLPNQASGRIQFSSRGLMPFQPYEVRLHLDWQGTRSYAIEASAPLTVFPAGACNTPTLVRVAVTVDQGTPLAFSFQNLKRLSSNWVAIARVSQTAPNFLKSKMLATAGRGNDLIDTSDLEPGTYELRLFEDWAGTKEYFIYDRAQFTVR